MKKAIFPGSFNPFHEGHLSIYKKASELFDEVIIYVSFNPQKNIVDSAQKRAEELSKQLPQAKVIHGKELTVEVAKKEGCSYLIRGIRNTEDMRFEYDLAIKNKLLDEGIETVLLFADEDVKNVSSSSLKLIKEIKNSKGKKTWKQ